MKEIKRKLNEKTRREMTERRLMWKFSRLLFIQINWKFVAHDMYEQEKSLVIATKVRIKAHEAVIFIKAPSHVILPGH